MPKVSLNIKKKPSAKLVALRKKIVSANIFDRFPIWGGGVAIFLRVSVLLEGKDIWNLKYIHNAITKMRVTRCAK